MDVCPDFKARHKDFSLFTLQCTTPSTSGDGIVMYGHGVISGCCPVAPYRIDRMLTQLRNAGNSRVPGLIVDGAGDGARPAPISPAARASRRRVTGPRPPRACSCSRKRKSVFDPCDGPLLPSNSRPLSSRNRLDPIAPQTAGIRLRSPIYLWISPARTRSVRFPASFAGPMCRP